MHVELWAYRGCLGLESVKVSLSVSPYLFLNVINPKSEHFVMIAQN